MGTFVSRGGYLMRHWMAVFGLVLAVLLGAFGASGAAPAAGRLPVITHYDGGMYSYDAPFRLVPPDNVAARRAPPSRTVAPSRVVGKPGPSADTHIPEDYVGPWPGWPAK
jgi:hypothetical protein